jgi:hypothetical protein
MRRMRPKPQARINDVIVGAARVFGRACRAEFQLCRPVWGPKRANGVCGVQNCGFRVEISMASLYVDGVVFCGETSDSTVFVQLCVLDSDEHRFAGSMI